ncbi:hypothetical protein SELMODRAFT_425231 [Selaginella moellendorffii]|uniref:Uncharacterized protein n=1 Tax=Selaginella moellendorffii TaxID=88036 RepID=D8SSF6_SELML|nr:hypothetical protein SELMODRAFT_425231 [Selaginella moellendorffii]
MDLDSQKEMLTDDSEIDFWDCHKEEATRTFFPIDEIDAEESLKLDESNNRTICTLNGEVVVMQTNVTYQHIDKEISGCASASKEYLEGQKHVQEYFDLQLQASSDLNGLQDNSTRNEKLEKQPSLTWEGGTSSSKDASDAIFSVSSKRRWPRTSKVLKTLTTGNNDGSQSRKVSRKTVLRKTRRLKSKREKIKAEKQSKISGTPHESRCPETMPTPELKLVEGHGIKDSCTKSTSLSAEKVCSILSFLKQVDSNNNIMKMSERSSPRTVLDQDDAFVAESCVSVPLESASAVSSAEMAFVGIKNKINELKEKNLKQKNQIMQLEAENESIQIVKNKDIAKEEAIRKQYEKLLNECQSASQAENQAMKHSFEMEQSEWNISLNERIMREVRKREPEIEARCIRERNREIDLIIDRMEKERNELVAEHRSEQANRGKAQSNAERSEMNKRMEKFKDQLRSQGCVIEQLTKQIGFEKQESDKLKNNLEACMKRQEKEIENTRIELQQSRCEMEKLKIRKVEELEEVENKVKLAIEKKNEVILGLHSELKSAHQHIRHTEQLLEQNAS